MQFLIIKMVSKTSLVLLSFEISHWGPKHWPVQADVLEHVRCSQEHDTCFYVCAFFRGVNRRFQSKAGTSYFVYYFGNSLVPLKLLFNLWSCVYLKILAKFAVSLQIRKKKKVIHKKKRVWCSKSLLGKKKKDLRYSTVRTYFPSVSHSALILVSPALSGQCFTMGMVTMRKNSSALRNDFLIWSVFFFLL